MHVGYACVNTRVSTKDQTIDLQIDALTQAGCTKVYTEVISGARAERPVLDQLFETLRAGDVLVIWKLDRLGRSLTHLLEIVTDLMTRQVGLKSLNDPIDTTTPQGRLIFNLFASLAEFEREVIRERTQAGLSAARARGRTGGRPKGIPRKAEATAYAAETLYREGRLSAQDIADKLHISKSTLYAYLRARGVPIGTSRGQPGMPLTTTPV
jgi:DNA invertase Pin-like site-specific DNA recombinase